jgi:prolyl-tRNA synthetase
MARLSSYLLPTEKQPPADAEALSHRLMVRAGLVRQVGSGLWTWLPAGWRVHQRAVHIVREEMNAIGGQEMLMPVLQPIELWRRTGRDSIDALFKLEDRRGAEMVLGMTHEEVITWHIAHLIRSYRDLPKILYQFQVKERDEPRPRAGILRTREFIMKDAYTFDRDLAGLEERYQLHVKAYDRVFDRCGLRWYRVEADVGMMGGHGGDEYMAPCAAGEDEVALAPGYAANIDVAEAEPQPVVLPAPLGAPEEVPTPGLKTIAAVAGSLGVPAGALLKAFPVMTEPSGGQPARLVMVMVRGDHRVNEIKLTKVLGGPFRSARDDEIESALGPPGSIGPVGLDGRVEIVLDEGVVEGPYITGANRPDLHLRGVQPGRDFSFRRADVRRVEAGDSVGGRQITIETAIEVGHIFKLGTRYSEPLGATYLDESGREQLIWMGSYGIGPARILAAAVEQFADERGISWPRSLAPFAVHLVSVGKSGSQEREAAEGLYAALSEGGIEVLYDDRDAGPGEKFADAELLGCPLRLTVGRRALESGAVEAQIRRGRRDVSGPPLHDGGAAVRAVQELWPSLP